MIFISLECATLGLDKEWKILAQGKQGGAVRASRTFDKGRVLIVEDSRVLCPEKKAKKTKEQKESQSVVQEESDVLGESETLKRQKELCLWVAGGKPPVGGDGILPQPRGGGGGIYPDQETRIDGIVAYYAKNQISDLLKVVKEDLTKTTEHVYRWLPSVKPEEPVMFILSHVHDIGLVTSYQEQIEWQLRAVLGSRVATERVLWVDIDFRPDDFAALLFGDLGISA